MPQTLVVNGGATATVYSNDSSVVPTDPPAFNIQNDGPEELTLKTYWGAPYLDGGWHLLGNSTIPAGSNQALYVGNGPYFHFKVEATNNGSQPTELHYYME
ncbi:hypothetical protein IW01_15925 [Pectobacterium brasiliense]|uniref:hypothetical protein n=1 Tax=Pectobacterium brasiliense TaxID=180957 RepID=UPI0004E6C1B6|nr:hypothetical protein [Pectobacterium brasiliense]KFF67823.1 hypothetical protein IW01_15925 [Pectobacterium brasiliense]